MRLPTLNNLRNSKSMKNVVVHFVLGLFVTLVLDDGRSTCAMAQSTIKPARAATSIELLPPIDQPPDEAPKQQAKKFTPRIIGFRTASSARSQDPKTNEVNSEDLPKPDEGEFVPVQPKKPADLLPLPPAERIVPLPIVPSEEGFPGFGPQVQEDEHIPNPNKPPAYVPPPKDTSPRSSADNPILKPWRMPIERMPTQPWTNPPIPNEVPVVPEMESEPDFIPGIIQVRDEMTLSHLPATDNRAIHVPPALGDFQPTPLPCDPANPAHEGQAYYGKTALPTQRPWLELWRPFYSPGQYPPAIPFPSAANPLTPAFLVYGDYRAGVGIHRDNGRNVRSLANRLNLDMDLKLTGTERFHAFMGPLDHNNRFTRLDFSDDLEFEAELDGQVDTAFFEGDLGAMLGGVQNRDAAFDLPFTFGLIPLVYQNGVWMEDAIAGVAFGFPWKHSLPLNWSNFDATFFAGFNQVTSPALSNNDDGRIFGTAWFIDAYQGYIEADYAYIHDAACPERSYHNAGLGYTRRYWDRVSNSMRMIINSGQNGPVADRSADGVLLLSENSLITSMPSTVVPYWNFFYGNGTPQSAARAANSGGVLRNTGINFETDGLTGYPTLSATGSNTYGMATGVNLLTSDFRRQLVLEFAAMDRYGADTSFSPAGAQYALGTRYQQSITNWTLFRFDLMAGMLEDAPDIYGSRFEVRWKF
jgi:hypothetical protein